MMAPIYRVVETSPAAAWTVEVAAPGRPPERHGRYATEAEARAAMDWLRAAAGSAADAPKEIGGPEGPEPTRYGDWEVNGRCSDF
jgi:hypothetical protein